MSLSSGIYTITNDFSSNRARLPNNDDQTSVTCGIPKSMVTDAEKWDLTCSAGGRYTIKNVKYNYYAATDVRPKVSAPVFGKASEDWWTIEEADSIHYGLDTYSILHHVHRDLSWTLQDGENDTPVDLQPFVNDRRSLWKILPYPPVPQKEFPFTDRSALSLNSVQQVAGMEYIPVQFSWTLLPQNFVLQFPEPLSVVSHSEVIAEVLVQGEFRTSHGILDAVLRVKDTAAFTAFAATVLRDDDIQVTLQINKFRYYPMDSPNAADRQYVYRSAWKKGLTFKGLHAFRERVTLYDLKILCSNNDLQGSHMSAVVTANIVNASRFSCVASITVGVYYNSNKVGTAQCKDLQLQPGNDNQKQVEWQFRPMSPVSPDIRNFMDQHFTTTLALPIVLSIESISANICGHLINLPQFDINSNIRGLGSKFIESVDVHIGAFSVLMKRSVSFTFNIENPLDAVLEIKHMDLDVFIKGAHIASVDYAFDDKTGRFIIPPRKKARSPKIPYAWLIASFTKTLQLAVFPVGTGRLDVKVKSATIRIDQFELQGLTYDLKGTEFNLHWSI